MSREPKLKPCPFCGGESKFEQVKGAMENFLWAVGCDYEECIGWQSTKLFARKTSAAEAWNKRAKDDEDPR